MKVKNIVISKQLKNYENCTEFLKLAKSKKINVIVVQAGDKLTIDKNTCFQVLWPDISQMITDNGINNNSMVAKLVYDNFSMLFTGDIEEIAEEAILNKYKNNLQLFNSTVLKVAHHGSKSSSIEEFLKVVRPKIALIGVGENNNFGHPSSITLNNLKEVDCKVYRTDKNGEIIIKTSGENIKINRIVKSN